MQEIYIIIYRTLLTVNKVPTIGTLLTVNKVCIFSVYTKTNLNIVTQFYF